MLTGIATEAAPGEEKGTYETRRGFSDAHVKTTPK